MAAVGNVARQLRDRTLRERSIRVLVSPTPITFAERRSVLQVLEQYGPVEFFKMLPTHYSQYVSITKESTTAERLVASSPLTYKITEPTRKAAEDIYVADLDEPEGFNTLQPTVTGERTNNASSGLNGDPKQGQTEFKIHIFPAPEHNHRFAMAGSPLHIPWPDAYEQEQSFIATTLKQSLPKSIASTGLVHWLVSEGSAVRMERKVKRKRIREWLPSKMKKGTTE
ncbi:hypothetical protein M441DRAFT_29327 [Trichoderma asperellum CBS 433.97]|uniref:Pal1-like protein n=2 Tax=Trichoderma asperellum TaxID=101201 RepID=A0A2T3Z2K9_TRIA4|nr:hypothetical protein M441DRAFT_29327 [Trichoderma asperellum CBS 433.97]PTB39033.1 hypothetical protein M441DRAFT_29327 [Trichoderma asperellum CBS 433.97]